MIGKISKGWNVPNLVAYLMGPGRQNEHSSPTVIAAWQGDPSALQPARVRGDFDYAPGAIRKLGEHVNATADAAGMPRVQPLPGKPGHTKHGYVWHCSVTLDPGDGLLNHDTWATIAADIMNATGIARTGDSGACRWIAVHHGQNGAGSDHIHIAAVLVRQDTGRRFYPQNDYAHVREVLRRWETALGIRATAAPDNSRATPHPTRGEQEKATRRAANGDDGLRTARPAESARVQLRQVIRESAAIATGPEEFLRRLREIGVLVQLRRDNRNRITGWAVAAQGDVSARTGRPIWWSVSRDIAADLSWPRLVRRWNSTTTRPDGLASQRTAGATLGDAAAAMRETTSRLRTDPDASDAEQIAYEAHAVFAAYAFVTSDHDPAQRVLLHDYERAVVTPKSSGALAARRLHQVAVDLAAIRTLLGVRRDPVIELASALAALVLEIGRWHQASQRPNHADRARDIAASLSDPSQQRQARRAAVADIPRPQSQPSEPTRRGVPPRPTTARSTRP